MPSCGICRSRSGYAAEPELTLSSKHRRSVSVSRPAAESPRRRTGSNPERQLHLPPALCSVSEAVHCFCQGSQNSSLGFDFSACLAACASVAFRHRRLRAKGHPGRACAPQPLSRLTCLWQLPFFARLGLAFLQTTCHLSWCPPRLAQTGLSAQALPEGTWTRQLRRQGAQMCSSAPSRSSCCGTRCC